MEKAQIETSNVNRVHCGGPQVQRSFSPCTQMLCRPTVAAHRLPLCIYRGNSLEA